MSSEHQSAPTPEEIAARAGELWRLAGSPPGGDAQFRATAEAELQKHRELTNRTAEAPASRGPERRPQEGKKSD